MEENKTMETDAVSGLLNATNGSHLVLRNIQNLKGMTFEIPAYQRGFRWRWQQIRELIDDLYEFCRGKRKKSEKEQDEKIYCLQTITVIKTDRKDENGNWIYEVVDGQQRLTAIWMLVVAFRRTSFWSLNLEEYLPVYTIRFDGKDNLTTYCKNVVDPKNDISSGTSDIDSKFISNGLQGILGYMIGANGCANILHTILADINILPDEDGEREKQICIFWNEISNVQIGQTYGQGGTVAEEAQKDVQAEEKLSQPENNQNGSSYTQNDDWAIERFSNLNAGKIPLTESELVKAYFIDKLNPNKVAEFSLQWEGIERGMSDDEFWGFLSSKEYETRIDLLLEITYTSNNSDNKSHSLSLKVANELKGRDAYSVWQDVIRCFQTMRDWYEDYYFYHMIGYIVAVDRKSSAEIIKELYNAYFEKSKTEFKKTLKERICTLDVLKPIFRKAVQEGEYSQEDFVCLDAVGTDLSYNGKYRSSVKPVLLLFNVALLVNAYEINRDNAAERFSFKLYKSKKNPIEIEHINPQHLEGKVIKEKGKKEWAKKVLSIIDNASEQLKTEINDPGKKITEKLSKQIEEAAKLHDISNLTLLDKKLNASYKDNFFSEKRRHILAARFGYPVPKGAKADNQKEGKDYYKQSVIFPGTMWVFLREYQSVDQLQVQSNGNEDFWTKMDREKYIVTMEDSIACLLETKDSKEPKTASGESEEGAE